MKRSLLLLFVAVIAVTSPGCSCMGINSQSDMRQYMRPGTPDEEEEVVAVKSPKNDKPKDTDTDKEPATELSGDSSLNTRLATELDSTQSEDQSPKEKENDGVESELVVDDPPAPEGPLTTTQEREIVIDRMKRIGNAIDDYVAKNGHFPKAAIMSSNKPTLSWRVELLPYLGYQELYAKFDTSLPWDHPKNAKLVPEIPNIYQDPGRRDTKAKHFTNILAVVFGSSVMTRSKARRPSDIEDGIDNTIMIVEANDTEAIPWTMPKEFEVDNPAGNVARMESKRADGTFVLWGGGLVSLIPKGTPDGIVWKAMTAEAADRFKIADLYHKAVGDPNDTSANALVTVIDNTPTTGDETPIGSGDAAATTQKIGDQTTPATTFSSRFPLYDFAIRAMSESRNRDASRYLHAAMLIDPTDEWMKRVKWSGGLRRPIAEVNWAVAATGTPNANPKGANKVADNKSNIVTGFSNATGELGKRFLELLYERADRGKFGPLIQGGVLSSKADVAKRGDDDEDNEYRSPNRGKIEPKISQEDEFSHTAAVFPGATIFTNQSERVLIELAKMREVDLLTIFQVTTKQTNRTGVKVTVQIKFIDGMTGEILDETASINNIEVRAARADPLRDDPTVTLFEEIESLMRSKYDLTSVPDGLRSQHVRRRVGVILSRPLENPMRYLVELRYYYASELLTGDEYRQGVSQILGDDAELFLNGSPQEKLSVLLPWMPKEYLDMNE